MRTEDGQIIQKCLNGDPAAFGLLVDKYKESIYALAYSKLGNFHDAEDVAQEVFIKAYEKLRTLKQYDSFLAWLYSITSNSCRMWIRSRSRRPDHDFIEDQDPKTLETSSMDSYRAGLMSESVSEALGSLPEMHRQVLTLFYLGGMSGKEIARLLGTSPNTIRQRLFRARAQLKKEMLAMMSATFERGKLPGGFTLRIVEAVRRLKIHPVPRTAGLPWWLSLATGIIIAVLNLGTESSLNDQINIFMGSASPMETTTIDDVDVPVDMLVGFQTPFPAGKHDGDQQKAYLLAEKGGVFGKPEAAPMASLQPDNRNVDLVWRDLIGTTYDVYVVGNYAYLCTALSLVILDIRDPENLTQIGWLDVPARGIDLAGNYAYIAATGDGICIVDISDPGNPREVGSCNISGYAVDVYVDGNYAYVADYSIGLCIIDISDPDNPEKVGECDTPGQAYKVHVANGYAYIAAHDAHLRIIDVSDPGNPREVSFCSTPKVAVDVCVDNGYAYVAGGEAGLRVIEISDPQSPQEVGFYDSPGSATGVYTAGGYVYLADYTRGFYIIDVSDPGNPRKVGNCDPPGYEWKVYMADDRVYVTDSNAGGLQVIDISDRTKPREVGFYDAPGTAWGVYVDKGYAYIAEGNAGMRIVDVSDPDNPRARGTWDSPGYSRKIHVVDGYAYIADLDFYVVDVSDPDNPREAGRYDTQGALYGIYVSENYAYVTDAVKGLSIIDVSNPRKPFEAGLLSIPWWGGGGVYVEDRYAFVTHWDTGLRVIDVSNPRNPREVGSCNIPEPRLSVHVVNSYAYIPSSATGLSIVDVSDPRKPKEVGSLNADLQILRDVYVAGSYAYLAAGDLYVIDVSDPRNPKEAGFYDTLSSVEDLQFVDGLVYAAANISGLYILKPDLAGMPVQPMGKLPSQWGDLKDGQEEMGGAGEYDFALIQNYPNPFNPETWIPFSLSKPGNVTIKIYSSSGQLIRTLDLGQKAPGTYLSREKAAYWDGRNDKGEPVASDVYFYVMEAGESYADVRKMVMVR